MYDLLLASILPVNLPYTMLMVLMLLYWTLYIFGFCSSEALEFLNVDLDLDADVDVGVDADLDVGGMDGMDVDADVGLDHDGAQIDAHHGGAHVSPTMAALHFFYVGQVPLMVIYSVLIISLWISSVLINDYLQNENGWIALAMFAPLFLLSLLVTKTILWPFAPFLSRVFDTSGDKIEVIGKTCIVTSLEANSQYGQAEFQTGDAPLVLNIVTRDDLTLQKGDEAVIYEHDEENDRYIVTDLR